MSESELESLRRQLKEAKSRRYAAEIRISQAESRISQAESRISKAEELTQSRSLQQYLEACHDLNLSIQVIANRPLTIQGDNASPAGRIFPRQILPWADFPTKQEEIWNLLSTGHIFPSQHIFPTQHQLDYVKSILNPIRSESGLRYFQRDVIEIAVQKLIQQVYDDTELRNNLGLQGTVTFESHTNSGEIDDLISEPMEHVFISNEDANVESSSARMTPAPKARRRARGKGNLADQFCVFRSLDSQHIPVLAIEYKPPHKLSVNELVTGLESDIWPERDVINKDYQGFTFTARALAAAVVTQLFSYMIGKGIRYGYVCTGQAFVFLHIPDDPAIVYFSVCVPNLDVVNDDDTKLHRTAVAQVLAFVLQALRGRSPPQSWHDKAQKLGIWDVEYDDILAKIPASERKLKEPHESSYKPQRWTGFRHSPILTRSKCRQMGDNVTDANKNNDDDNGIDEPPSPSLTSSCTTGHAGPSTRRDLGGRRWGQRSNRQGQSSKIQSRPYCTQKCLLGLANGGAMDHGCPNFSDHGSKHITRLKFLSLIRTQLAIDRGQDADCEPLHLSGSVGSLFKVRLSFHGYTLVAKGMESFDLARMKHENEIYNRLITVQGRHVPVCLGRVDLKLPYYYNSGVYIHFLFLSWAGRPLFDCINDANKAHIVEEVTTALQEMHKLQVIHGDAEPRNMLYDANIGNPMLVDFERAQSYSHQPLGLISPNSQRKRKRWILQKGDDIFKRELQSTVEAMSRAQFDQL